MHDVIQKCYVVMASLDHRMAFDMVDTGLLIKRLRIMGMPNDIIKLIKEWLVGRTFYVQVGDDCFETLGFPVGKLGSTRLSIMVYMLTLQS